MQAAKAEAVATPAPDRAGRQEQERASEPMVTTAIHVPKKVLALLRRVAVERANIEGGRPSVSAVLVDLVRERWAELEKESGQR
jgi:hypothetical protein